MATVMTVARLARPSGFIFGAALGVFATANTVDALNLFNDASEMRSTSCNCISFSCLQTKNNKSLECVCHGCLS